MLRRRNRQEEAPAEREQLLCPVSLEPCVFFPVCKARQEQVTRGMGFLPEDFKDRYPQETGLLADIEEIISREFCAEVTVNALWGIVEDEARDEVVRATARDLAASLIEIRAQFVK